MQREEMRKIIMTKVILGIFGVGHSKLLWVAHLKPLWVAHSKPLPSDYLQTERPGNRNSPTLR